MTHPFNSRWEAASLLNAVLKNGKSIADLNFPDALSQELVYGTLRFYFRLERYLSQLLDDPKKVPPLLFALCLIGLYQLEYLSIASHAAVNETVSAASYFKKPWAKGLVNAVLRRFLREKEILVTQFSNDLAFKTAFPSWLVQKLQTAWPEQWEQIILYSNARPPMTLRVNRAHLSRETYVKKLIAPFSLPANCPDAVILEAPVSTSELPGFMEGEVSIQDAGAQLAAFFLAPQNHETILDACAAPGGKAAHLLQLAPKINLTAVDISASRMERMKKDFMRMQIAATFTVADILTPDCYAKGQRFDAILCDAPCSATGVIRRHPDIKWLRKPKDLAKLTALQLQCLQTLFSLLKPGGRLLYVTCSILPEENEVIIKKFIQQTSTAVILDLPNIAGMKMEHGLQLLPNEEKMDGFYYALLQKQL